MHCYRSIESVSRSVNQRDSSPCVGGNRKTDSPTYMDSDMDVYTPHTPSHSHDKIYYKRGMHDKLKIP